MSVARSDSPLLPGKNPTILVIFSPEVRPKKRILLARRELAKLPRNNVFVVATFNTRSVLSQDQPGIWYIGRRTGDIGITRTTADHIPSSDTANLLQRFVCCRPATGTGKLFLFLTQRLIESLERVTESVFGARGSTKALTVAAEQTVNAAAFLVVFALLATSTLLVATRLGGLTLFTSTTGRATAWRTLNSAG